jgi:hypothetical protein
MLTPALITQGGAMGCLSPRSREGRMASYEVAPEVASGRLEMLTFVFLFFIAVFAVAGIAISISAKKRRDGREPREVHPRNDSPSMGRANSDED